MTAKKDNSGALFKNDKRDSDLHPHAKGSALIDGVEYWISAWTNTSPDGVKYQSLKFKRKDAGQEQKPNAPEPKTAPDDVPF